MTKELAESIERMTRPHEEVPFVYKYKCVNQYFYEAMINGEMWFASPLEFNDPFDSNIAIDNKSNEEQIKAFLQAIADNESQNTVEVQQLLQKAIEQPDAIKEMLNGDARMSLLTQGVSCFSKHSDNILMWSHYADCHRGVCLKFDTSKDKAFFSPLLDVHYPENYPVVDNHHDNVARIIKTKSIDWQYEAEIRVVKEKRGLFLFNKEALVEVIFGCRTSERQIKTIKNLVENNGYKDVVLKRARLKSWQFGLEFEDIKNE